MKKWSKYQNVLWKVVQRRTGKSVYSKLKEDVENLFFDLYSGNTTGIMKAELHEVLKMTTVLAEIYPEELKSAKARVAKNKILTMQYTPKNNK